MTNKFLNEVEQLILEIDKIFSERKLTDKEKEKREQIAKAIKRDQPDMPMAKKMAIATATAKRVAEQDELDLSLDQDLEGYFTKQDEEEEGMFDDVSTEDLLNPDAPAPWEKK